MGEWGQLVDAGPSGGAGPRLSLPGPGQGAPSLSRVPDWERALVSGLRRPPPAWSPGPPSTSCNVCSSGDELDLLRGWAGWKERSAEGRTPSDTARSMGIPSELVFPRSDFSSWLEVEDDCGEGQELVLGHLAVETHRLFSEYPSWRHSPG